MFWENYLQLCGSVGKSPNAVAAELGIKSSGTVTGWKNGSLPRSSVLMKIADYFGVSTTDLLAGHSVRADEPDEQTRAEAIADAVARKLSEPARPSDDDIKFALFGGGDTTDEMYEEVLRFAQFVKERKKNRGDQE